MNIFSFSRGDKLPSLPTSFWAAIIDRQTILTASKPLNLQQIRSTLKDFRVRELGEYAWKNAQILFGAIFGEGEDKLRKAIKRHSQISLKAYGLLPLPSDQATAQKEVLDRYLSIREFERASRKFGSERRTNSKAAVSVALSNLAQTAGYDDADRLEWAMEAQLAESGDRGQSTSINQAVSIGDYNLHINIKGGRPLIQIEKKGRILKSVPSTVRKNTPTRNLSCTRTS